MQLEVDIRKRLVQGTCRFELDVAFRCDAQRLVLLGPSGSGKSLTLKAIAGLMTPDAGLIRLGGRTLFDAARGVALPARERRMGYLFQDYALMPHLTVRQNVAFGVAGSRWFNPARRVRAPEAERWIDAFGLAALADAYPHTLSGGQRQRAALARALAAKPEALLLDEPFAALDAPLRARMRAELSGLLAHTGIPLVLISHDPDDAAAFGDAVFTLADGRLATRGAT
ncbi:ATP-binding cassette domain-containing protein [Crenobacter intestini]|uniref:ATP-binding cassette domain-containing protein n=1 Tax=Crenobacter intestini TaxID=2563443 RepID=A0A4T0UWA1_9NEIS|nr:ATP-binding cassette domain-containing protein [Crenobacter intestini]TIC83137.1 ATP-binding cassette domain-containing protein [Crenobacter intestini]